MRFRKTFKTKKSRKGDTLTTAERFYTIGGVYFVDFESDTTRCGSSSKSLSSMETDPTECGDDDDESTNSDSGNSARDWKYSGSSDHDKGAPLLAKTFSRHRLNPTNVPLSDEELMGFIVQKSVKLPKKNEYLASNHVLINFERTTRGIAPLKRSRALDDQARAHALLMAEESQLFHSDCSELYNTIEQKRCRHCGRRIGENVAKGLCMEVIHTLMMRSLSDKNNILDRRFTYMGIGTAKAVDGSIYLCQLYSD